MCGSPIAVEDETIESPASLMMTGTYASTYVSVGADITVTVRGASANVPPPLIMSGRASHGRRRL